MQNLVLNKVREHHSLKCAVLSELAKGHCQNRAHKLEQSCCEKGLVISREENKSHEG